MRSARPVVVALSALVSYLRTRPVPYDIMRTSPQVSPASEGCRNALHKHHYPPGKQDGATRTALEQAEML